VRIVQTSLLEQIVGFFKMNPNPLKSEL